jgi:RNA recognition motif-containing protein
MGVLAEGQEKLGEHNEPGAAEARKMLLVDRNSVNRSRGESCSRFVRHRNVWSVPMKKIYVGNLSVEATEAGIGAAFTAFGMVQGVSIVRDRHSGEPRGFGFVEMESSDEADAAIAALNGTQLNGRAVAVNEARSRVVKTG